MEQENWKKLIILPNQKTAFRKIFANAFFYALGFVLLLVGVLWLVFPKFFFLLQNGYAQKFFISQAVAHVLFVRMTFAFLAIFLLSFASYLLLVLFALQQKEIKIILSAEGLVSCYGKFAIFQTWNEFKRIRITTNPWRLKWPMKNNFFVYDVFEKENLQKKIEEYAKIKQQTSGGVSKADLVR